MVTVLGQRIVQNIMAGVLIKIVKSPSFKMQFFCFLSVGRCILFDYRLNLKYLRKRGKKGDMVVWPGGSSQLNSCLGVTKNSDTFVYKKV